MLKYVQRHEEVSSAELNTTPRKYIPLFNSLKLSGYLLYEYVRLVPCITSAFCPQSFFLVCSMWFAQETDYFSEQHWAMIFVAETQYVPC
jgi:hypothetical protein